MLEKFIVIYHFLKKNLLFQLDDAIITGVYGSQRILNGIPKVASLWIRFCTKKRNSY